MKKKWILTLGAVIFFLLVMGYRRIKDPTFLPSFGHPGTPASSGAITGDSSLGTLRDPVACHDKMTTLVSTIRRENGLFEKQDLLTSHPEMFRLNGSVLEIGPATKPIHKLENKNGDTFETFVQYEPFHWFEDTGFVLIHYNLYEGDGYALLNMKGADLSLPAVPYFSPQRKFFAVISPAEESGYNWAGAQVYSIGEKNFTKEFEKELSLQETLVFLKWLDDETIEMAESAGAALPDHNPPYNRPMRISHLVRRNGTWIVEPTADWIPGCEP